MKTIGNAPLIGIIGKKRVGKDTFASTLIEKFGYEKIALADPLREAALALDPIVGTFPMTVDGVLRVEEWRYSEVIANLGYEKAKDYCPEVRRTLQRFGTESIRAIDDEFWIRAAFTRINERRSNGTPVVVTDVRYPNEADAIRKANGFLVRITRDLPEGGDAHISERSMDGYREDLWVANNGTQQELESVAEELARQLAAIYGALFS